MFRVASVLLTSLAVLWHATAGCCLHHAHAAVPGEGMCHAPHASASSPHCRHSHDHPDADATPDSDPSPRLAAIDDCGSLHCEHHDPADRCAGERCSFPLPGVGGDSLVKRIVSSLDDLPTLAFAVGDIGADPASLDVSPSDRDGANAPNACASGPLRRHLALQVLLI